MENLHEQLEAIEDYTSVLEEALVALCAELEIDPVELVEDIMTDERQREHAKRLRSADRRARESEKFGRSDGVDYWTGRQALRAKTARKEQRSTKLYGKGGKVLERKPTDAERKTSKDWYEKRQSRRERLRKERQEKRQG
jgi:hypothetical protein